MRKSLPLLVVLLLFVNSCTLTKTAVKSVPTTTKLTNTDSKKVEIEILNPSDSEKNSVDWYPDDTNSLIMKVNAKAKVIGTVTLKDQTKSSNIKWSSSDNTLVTVNDQGIIQANKIGNTTILATSFVDTSYKQVLNIKVVDDANFTPEKLTEVEKVETQISNHDEKSKVIDNNNLIVLSGAKINVVGKVFLQDNTRNSNVLWSSSDEKIATVDQEGNITIKDTAKNGSVVSIIAKYRLNPQAKQVINIDVVNELPKDDVEIAEPIPNIDDFIPSNIPTISALITPTPTVAYTSTPTPIVSPTPTPVIATPTPTPTAIQTPRPTPTPNFVGNETKAKIGENNLNKSGGIAFKNGKIYVTNWSTGGSGGFKISEGEVKIFDTAGTLVKTIQGAWLNSLPTDLTGIVTDGDRMWFTNKTPYAQLKNNLYSFDSAGNNRVDSQVGLISSGTNLKDMAIDSNSNTIYVADGQLGNVIKLTYSAGTITEQQMYFISNIKPSGICIDDLGNILVVSNSGTSNQIPIVKYGKNGTEMLRFTTAGKNSAGPSVSSVGDVAYDPRNGGTIYVVAQLSSNSKIVILRFDSQGNFIRYFGEDVGMINPVGIEVGSDGTLYVLDQGANLIHQFGPAK